jgi:hypothetical protein
LPVARVLGRDIALWAAGTRLSDAIARARAYTTTFTVPDTMTPWPQALERLALGRDHANLPAEHPAAFTLLAADTADVLATVRQTQTALPDGLGIDTMSTGGGSAAVPGSGTVTPYDGIKARAGSGTG